MAEKPKSKRELRREVIAELSGVETMCYQKCPYTCVVVVAYFVDTMYRAIAFSKVSWPDTYSDARGLELAVTRALKDIANQIIEKNNLDRPF
jgi:phenylpyruvate tautomerase PptA (4-oxalocrotonate tautomerase family)